MRFDAVQIIKDRLTMQEVLERYGYTAKRRIPCPLHNGNDNNFEVKEHSFMCYSQCGGGDIITFVQKLFNISFPDALKKIDVDFGLNLYGDHTFEELRKSHYQTKKLQAKKEREKAEREQSNVEYWAAFDECKRLEDNKQKFAPKTPSKELHPLFVEALQKLSYQTYLLDCLETRRHLLNERANNTLNAN